MFKVLYQLLRNALGCNFQFVFVDLPQKKSMSKKEVKIKFLEGKPSEKDVTYELLEEKLSERVTKLLNVYKENPFKARVLYFNDKSNYETHRLCLFTRPNGSFEICIFRKKFGVSTTNRIYTREAKILSIIHKDKKFWFINNDSPKGKVIRPLTIGGVHSFQNIWSYTLLKHLPTGLVYDILHKRFGFIGFLFENSELHTFPFTTVLQKKLFSYKDVMRYKYKSPYPTAMLAVKGLASYSNQDRIKLWKEILKVLVKPDHLTEEFFKCHYFLDACKMAATLDKKVNCTWGLKRLKQEHDDWSREITKIVLEAEPLRELRIRNVYTEFEKFSGYTLLKTNKDLLYEGMTQSHCVGTYIDKVDSGSTGIYHVDGGTLQLKYEIPYNRMGSENRFGNRTVKRLVLVQFRTFKNDPLPKEVNDRVLEKVIEFNELLESLELKDDDESNNFLSNLDIHPKLAEVVVPQREVEAVGHEVNAYEFDFDF